MPLVRKIFATSMIAAACALPGALLFSSTASADPAPAPVVPGMPNMPFLSALSPASAPALLQGLASAFGAPATAAAPAAALADQWAAGAGIARHAIP